MKLSVVHDQFGPRVFDAETGNPLLGVKAVRYEAAAHAAGLASSLTIELHGVQVRVDANSPGCRSCYVMTHPKFGRLSEVKSIEFADGRIWRAVE